MDAELAIPQGFHFTVGGMEFNPVFVAPETVPRMQLGIVPVGHAGQGIQPVAGNLAQTSIMRRHVRPNPVLHAEFKQALQLLVYFKEIQAPAVWGDPVFKALLGNFGCRVGHSLSPGRGVARQMMR